MRPLESSRHQSSPLDPSFPRTVLVLETDPLRRERIRQLLAGEGVAAVHFAAKGSEAFALLASTLVDLVITPWAAGDVEGKALLRGLQGRGANRRMPVVLLDAGMPSHLRVQAVKQGVVTLLHTPVTAEAVARALAAVREQAPRSH